mgnify:CR=1 FL=1
MFFCRQVSFRSIWETYARKGPVPLFTYNLITNSKEIDNNAELSGDVHEFARHITVKKDKMENIQDLLINKILIKSFFLNHIIY